MVNQRILGVFTLAMINVAAIISLRNLSIMVEYGFASIFYYLLAAFVFFIPTALVCAELATGWPHAGGLYAWVSEAFGKKVGFFAVWISWMLSISWYPTVLTFTAGAFAYIFNPALIHNKHYMVVVMLSVFWIATFVNFLGMKTSGWISSMGAILGTLLPGILIISLGMIWLYLGNPIKMEVSMQSALPEFRLESMVFFAGVLLGLAGMEMSAFHAREAKNPQRDYPRAILISAVIILAISILGSLSIAFVVSKTDVSLFAGLMQAYEAFFHAFGMVWAVPVLAFMAVVGSLAGINTWILGPAKGILTCATDGFLPPFLQKVNKNNMPIGTLLFQAVIASSLTLIFFFMPDVNSSFWIVTALTIQFAMIMYILIFAAGIRLRYTQKEVLRHYRVPGKNNMGMWIVACLGILASLFAMTICFIPPAQLNMENQILYKAYLIVGLVTLSLPPLLFIMLRKAHWISK
ncbi:amino acid permease [Candidatus Berkiella cookevillensis]|uniref:Amino acid permease n=1 Tax=Candidatus Berkiella cookevillensis TaxID=437022 RepID=A0A0Q9YR75_9GAMM|nr:amino acid permease [Candidatus Berkiella cookevillensis]MCS5708892.1 amino acid permease [Candidatus Berkiella cookevillensis]